MKIVSVFAVLSLCALTATAATGSPAPSLVCSYAPSQSNVVATVSKAAAGGAAATAAAVAAATGLSISAVAHSSGMWILSGSAGYIVNTIGVPAAALVSAPVIITAGVVVGGTAVALELVCAPQNHPAQVRAVEHAAGEFRSRLNTALIRAAATSAQVGRSISPAAGRAAVEVKRVTGGAIAYANRASVVARGLLPG